MPAVGTLRPLRLLCCLQAAQAFAWQLCYWQSCHELVSNRLYAQGRPHPLPEQMALLCCLEAAAQDSSRSKLGGELYLTG